MPLTIGNLYYIWCSFIDPPHEKISICICDERPLFFWVNSAMRHHGIAQVEIQAGETAGIVAPSYADLSSVKTASPNDLRMARDYGQISEQLRQRLFAALSVPIASLPEAHRLKALDALS